jgi:hypothetical protein
MRIGGSKERAIDPILCAVGNFFFKALKACTHIVGKQFANKFRPCLQTVRKQIFRFSCFQLGMESKTQCLQVWTDLFLNTSSACRLLPPKQVLRMWTSDNTLKLNVLWQHFRIGWCHSELECSAEISESCNDRPQTSMFSSFLTTLLIAYLTP